VAARAQSRTRILAKLREVLLALPETSETTSWGHPNFRAGKRTFAAFHEDRSGVPCIWLRVEPGDARILLEDPRFLPSKHGGDRWVALRADGPLDWRFLRDLARDSHALVMDQAPARARAT
jgi:predicted DNA-binding protein (MmcQ/YjbR family)